MNENNQTPIENQQPVQNMQQTNNTPTVNSQVPNQPSTPQPEKKNNTTILIVIIAILVLALIGLGAKMFLGNNKADKDDGNKDTPPTQEVETGKSEETPTTPATPPANDPTSISQAVVNGVTINFPCTKEAFNGTGWSWDEKYAKTDLAANYTTSGGRIGQYPGGVVVSVINDSTETKHIEDCTIDDGTFYNPGDGSKSITFVGGIDFSYNIDNVKEKMTSLGYKNVKESTVEKSVNLSYFLNDDQNNFKDQIVFNFYDNVLKSVEIRTAG